MITLICAIGKNGEIGKNNSLIWHLKQDMQFFKEKTVDKTVIMGYNTFASIGKPLALRKNVVITKDKNKIKDKNVIICSDVAKLIDKIKDDAEEYFVIGGERIYNIFYQYAKKMFITLIYEEDKEADAYFPKINENEWTKKLIKHNKENGIDFDFILYERLDNE